MGRRATLLSAATAAAMALGGLSLATAGPANAYTDGSWKVSCTVSHSAADDPIVLPNRPGASHLHDFFGNASLNAFSTYESMQGVRSTCPNQDRSSYWVPALYQNGRKVNPAGVTVYYVSPVTDQSTIEAFPPNFRMIAGNAKNADPAKMSGHIQWGCLGNTQIGRVVPAACPDADGIQARITFPSCWNGVWAPNGGDNAVNMRFPSRNACPAGFGRVLPTMRMNVAYLLGKTTGTVTLASGGWPSIHADFFNGWDQPTLEGLVKRCLHGKIDCQHFKGSTPGRAPAAQPQPPAGPKRAGAGKPAPVTAARPAGGSPAPAPADPPAPVSPSDPGVAPGAVAPAVPAGAVPAPAGPASGAEPPVGAQADSTVVLDAAPEDAQRRSTAAGRWHLVSAEGALNVPVAAGGTLLVLAFLMSCGLLVRAAVRRRQTHPVAGGSPPFGRPAAGRR